MNIKAERIEQLIQLVNRNLSLVFSGQVEGNRQYALYLLYRNIYHF